MLLKPSVTVELHGGDIPMVAAAVHDGHAIRDELTDIMALSDMERLREEDPFTGFWANIVDTRIIANRSRFEVDLNRPREKAVYLDPDDAWGLNVWRTRPGPKVLEDSLASYDAFYQEVERGFTRLKQQYGRFIVFDLHTYNHRRDGANSPPADPELNPEVNIGTGTMDRQQWAPIVDRFINDLGDFDFLGRHLDVRENIKFKGGQFSRWVHEHFPESACCIAVEFKKFFMDEWTGIPDQNQLNAISAALNATIPGVLEELKSIQLA